MRGPGGHATRLDGTRRLPGTADRAPLARRRAVPARRTEAPSTAPTGRPARVRSSGAEGRATLQAAYSQPLSRAMRTASALLRAASFWMAVER
ncbi:hypothetical protein SUDANB60_04222 [Streptomyces sp. enrichment culture]